MINSKKELRDYLEAELPRYSVGKFVYFLQGSETAILRKHQKILRKTEYYTNTHKRLRSLFYRYRLNKIQNKYALHIPINTCGKGLRIMHLGPILINGDVRTGENCVFHINTCIVAGGVSGVPVLGNNIIVGVGAIILGNVSIADGVAVGANAVVTKSIDESDIAVAGIPAHKVSNNGKSSWNKKA